MFRHYLLFFISIISCAFCNAQFSISSFSSTYSQNFNSLAASSSASWSNNSTLPNWYLASKKRALGTITADDGSLGDGGFYSFGSSGSTDRALGTINTSPIGELAFGVRMKNNTGSVIRAFEVTYTGEQWRNSNYSSQNLSFSYQVSNQSITSVSSASGTWTVLDPLKFVSKATGGNGIALNGNSTANSATVTYYITGLNIPNGSEIMFRWVDVNHTKTDHALAIDDVIISPKSVTNFYLKSNSDPSNLASWGTSSSGTGTSPGSFSTDAQIYNLNNSTNFTIASNWIVTGTGSKIIVGDGTNATNFTIPANYAVSGTVEVLNNSTLTVKNTNLPALGMLAANSTVVFDLATEIAIPGNVYGNLTLRGASTKTLASNTEVNGILNISAGHLNLGTYNLNMGSGSTITGADSTRFIITGGKGSLTRPVASNNTNVSFPVGKAGHYAPVLLRLTNSSTADNFSVRVEDKVYYAYDSVYNPKGKALTTHLLNNTWFIDEEDEGGSNATITLQWNKASEATSFDRSSCTIIHFDDVNGWETNTYAAASGSGPFTRTITGFTDFSPFSVSGYNAPLPVVLVSFKGEWKNNNVQLQWKTASEINNSHFEVEKSEDVNYWQLAGIVNGNGSSNKLNTYNFTDNNPGSHHNSVLYYRLRQVDFNGAFEYSNIISLRTNGLHCNDINIWHNSAERCIYLNRNCTGLSYCNIMLVNSFGNVVYSAATSLQGTTIIPAQLLKTGIYYLRINDGHSITSRSVLVVN